MTKGKIEKNTKGLKRKRANVLNDKKRTKGQTKTL